MPEGIFGDPEFETDLFSRTFFQIQGTNESHVMTLDSLANSPAILGCQFSFLVGAIHCRYVVDQGVTGIGGHFPATPPAGFFRRVAWVGLESPGQNLHLADPRGSASHPMAALAPMPAWNSGSCASCP